MHNSEEYNQVIGWYTGNKRQYVRRKSWGNVLDTEFTITDCLGETDICKIRYFRKEHELVFPVKGKHHLFIGNYALFYDDYIELTSRNPHEACDYPAQLRYIFIEVDELVAEDFCSGFERTLFATDGTQFKPDENPEDMLSQMVEAYLQHFLKSKTIPCPQ